MRENLKAEYRQLPTSIFKLAIPIVLDRNIK